jgi:hypothetical protein
VGNELIDEQTRQAAMKDFFLRQNIVSEKFSELGHTGIDESMASKMGLCRYS